MNWRVLEGDVLDRLADLEDGSVQTCVTSPPYWGLRDYGTGEWDGGDAECDHKKVQDEQAAVASSTLGGGKKSTGHIQEGYGSVCGRCSATRIDRQLGLEACPDEYVARLVGVFREVRRVLRDDGTVWLNLGDSYNAYNGGAGPSSSISAGAQTHERPALSSGFGLRFKGLKPKDLVGIPWRVAFALQQDGWWLRSDIVWSKPNPMPESVTDRPTRSHEYVFLLTKNARYFYDADAIREDATVGNHRRTVFDNGPQMVPPGTSQHNGIRHAPGPEAGRNKRSVWHVATQPFHGAHFAVFPPKLIEPCVLAGCPPKCCGVCGAPWERVVERTSMVVREGPGRQGAKDAAVGSATRTQVTGTMLEGPTSRTTGWRSTCAHDDDTGSSVVLDPFAGSGTTGVVALRHNRSFVGIELNPEYAAMARDRIRDDAPLLNTGLEVGA